MSKKNIQCIECGGVMKRKDKISIDVIIFECQNPKCGRKVKVGALVAKLKSKNKAEPGINVKKATNEIGRTGRIAVEQLKEQGIAMKEAIKNMYGSVKARSDK